MPSLELCVLAINGANSGHPILAAASSYFPNKFNQLVETFIDETMELLSHAKALGGTKQFQKCHPFNSINTHLPRSLSKSSVNDIACFQLTVGYTYQLRKCRMPPSGRWWVCRTVFLSGILFLWVLDGRISCVLRV